MAYCLTAGGFLFCQQVLFCLPAVWLSVLPAGAFLFAGSVVSSLLLLYGGAVGGLLASGKWCRLQLSRVLPVVPFAASKGKYNWSHNKIDYLLSGNSLRCFACGFSHSRGEGIGAHCLPLYIGTPASLSATASWPASLPQRRLSAVATPRRPGQQQTSSGGEEYSGLASNLAHLGRIC